MKTRLSRTIVASVLALAMASAVLIAQTFNLQDTIPFDTAVRTATLPNGLTYFIRKNAQPARRVSLRLAVKAGSLFEADDQLGLAHLIEHMAFSSRTSNQSARASALMSTRTPASMKPSTCSTCRATSPRS